MSHLLGPLSAAHGRVVLFPGGDHGVERNPGVAAAVADVLHEAPSLVVEFLEDGVVHSVEFQRSDAEALTQLDVEGGGRGHPAIVHFQLRVAVKHQEVSTEMRLQAGSADVVAHVGEVQAARHAQRPSCGRQQQGLVDAMPSFGWVAIQHFAGPVVLGGEPHPPGVVAQPVPHFPEQGDHGLPRWKAATMGMGEGDDVGIFAVHEGVGRQEFGCRLHAEPYPGEAPNRTRRQRRARPPVRCCGCPGYSCAVRTLPFDPARDDPGRAPARDLVASLQTRLVTRLEAVGERMGQPLRLRPRSWLRDAGQHGGGTRLAVHDTALLQRASVNISSVFYDDLADKALASATALSAIVHPEHPRGPSVHLHISWTARRDGTGGWRIMADLNPSLPHAGQTAAFRATLASLAGPAFAAAAANGDRYFFIPALDRHRGVVHFYLEDHDSGHFGDDLALARRVGEGIIDRYAALLLGALEGAEPPSDAERESQLAYHTLYLFQVLTLDRGTTSGLLVHSDNDVGILGSLPARVDRELLASWAARAPPPQDALVHALVRALPDQRPSPVCDETKARLAHVVRNHYRAHPEALELQARGATVPPTVANHGGRQG